MCHKEKITWTLHFIYKLLLVINQVEWIKGICHLWSRGRNFSPSLSGDRYLTPISQKRLPGRNLWEHRSVWCSGNVSKGTTPLVFCSNFSWADVPTINRRKKKSYKSGQQNIQCTLCHLLNGAVYFSLVSPLAKSFATILLLRISSLDFSLLVLFVSVYCFCLASFSCLHYPSMRTHFP